MSSYSSIDNMLVLEALENYDFSGISRVPGWKELWRNMPDC
jgi:hypothetical protein